MELEPGLQKELSRRTRRGFLVGGIASAAGLAGWEWLRSQQGDGIPWPLRRGLEANQALTEAYFSPSRLAREFPREAAQELKPNGDIGIDDDDFDPLEWKLVTSGISGGPVEIKMPDIAALPRVEMTTEFKCIEGWSYVVHWAGARMADFAKKYTPSGHNEYVSLETPDGDYYVGLDMASAMHPQTLLAYEMNGAPLTAVHGAPLRLVIPLKYGVKNLKRIGNISFTNQRPKDYWAERGYDWYAGF
jgi:DMSO/TMAO reductase YedYZ molybdopterin-dependent catalytic subunit